jgi:cytochrome c556
MLKSFLPTLLAALLLSGCVSPRVMEDRVHAMNREQLVTAIAQEARWTRLQKIEFLEMNPNKWDINKLRAGLLDIREANQKAAPNSLSDNVNELNRSREQSRPKRL